MSFHETVNKAMNQQGVIAKADKACDALRVMASPNVILNVSDGHNQGVLTIDEEKNPEMMAALRAFAQLEYTETMCEMREVVND